MAEHGITLNPSKFEFSQETIEFAGFVVSMDKVKPPEKILNAILSFPRPTNISGVRGWFGLVNQVAHYSVLNGDMKSFKPLLSPKIKFMWDEKLEKEFKKSKVTIVERVKHGIAIFKPDLSTIVNTDWSITGIAYWMYQKTCSCPFDPNPNKCCETGWNVTLANSRFLRPSEKNYWPTEGEALAVAWALEDSKFFTLGCKELHVTTDHRPLISLLGNKELVDINNRNYL